MNFIKIKFGSNFEEEFQKAVDEVFHLGQSRHTDIMNVSGGPMSMFMNRWKKLSFWLTWRD